MIIGQRYWILIWYLILTIGAVGLLASLYWGRQTHWKNLDEILRAVGTITVSLGMLLLLSGAAELPAQILMVASLVAFVAAFVLGRKRLPDRTESDDDEEDRA